MEQPNPAPFPTGCLVLCLLGAVACAARISCLWLQPPLYARLLLTAAVALPLLLSRRLGPWRSEDPRMKEFKHLVARYDFGLLVIVVASVEVERPSFLGYPLGALFLYAILAGYVGVHFYGGCILSRNNR